jgi:glutathione peroxidase
MSGSIYDIDLETLSGERTTMGAYRGKVLLIVNVASKCGFTPQYAGLQALQDAYGDRGFTVLGFPCNQFGKQEPGDASEIREFCTKNYGVTFDLFSKIDVNDDEAAPLYKFLTSEETNPGYSGEIGWNFEKFLISRDGKVVARFKTPVKPDSDEVVKKVEAEIKKKS